MIEIHEDISAYLEDLNRSDLRTLIILSAYFPAGEIPFAKIHGPDRFWSTTEGAISDIEVLSGKLGWRLIRSDGGIQVEDTHCCPCRTLRINFSSSSQSGTNSVSKDLISKLPPKGGSINNRSVGVEGDQDMGRTFVEALESAVTDSYSRAQASAINIVNYFLSKKKALDPLITIDPRERGRNLGMIKTLMVKYPAIDEALWKKAIDFFFDSTFWAPNFSNLGFLDRHLQKFLTQRPKKPRVSPYKVI